MSPKIVQRRRSLFWELFSTELFYVRLSPGLNLPNNLYLHASQSLALGRPPSIRLSYIDTEFPDDDEATVDEHGNALVGCEAFPRTLCGLTLIVFKFCHLDYRWKYEFAKEVFASVIELTLTAETPHYQTILDLDRKVREKTFFPHLNAFISPDDDQSTPSVYMKQSLLGQYRSISKSRYTGH